MAESSDAYARSMAVAQSPYAPNQPAAMQAASELSENLINTSNKRNELTLYLPRPPSLNNAYSNSQRGGRRKSAKARAWETEALWEIKRQWPGAIGGKTWLTYYFERPERGPAPDLGNLEKLTTDVLVSAGVIDDDRHAHGIELYWLTRTGPGVVVRIRPWPVFE